MKGANETMEVNEEKRQKFMENAGKRVNKVMHDIQILEPMSRSSVYDFTKQDVEEMFFFFFYTLNTAKEEFIKKFEEIVQAERRVFSFGGANNIEQLNEVQVNDTNIEPVVENIAQNVDEVEITEEKVEV